MAVGRPALRVGFKASFRLRFQLQVWPQWDARIVDEFYFSWQNHALRQHLGGCRLQGFLLCSCLIRLILARCLKSIVLPDLGFHSRQGHS